MNNAIHHLLTTFLPSPQGFLSDLLKKANKSYDEKKLHEYTQTIVSIPTFWITAAKFQTFT